MDESIVANPDQYVTTVAAARFCCVAVETMKKWRAKKVGPPYTKPTRGAVRYYGADLIEFMHEKTVCHEHS